MENRKPWEVPLQSRSQRTYSGTEELLELEANLPGYNRDVVRKIANGLGVQVDEGASRLTVLEFGAGTGALAEIWRREFSIKPICIEIDPVLIQILQSKGFEYDEISNLLTT